MAIAERRLSVRQFFSVTILLCTMAACDQTAVSTSHSRTGGSANPNQAISVSMPVLTDEASIPVAAIYTEHSPWEYQGPQISVAVWNDGRIIWSGDLLKGGPPYRVGTVAPQQVEAFLDRLDARGVFRDQTLNQANFGPDAPVTTIAIADGARQLNMMSWHELFEEDPDLVVTSSGVVPLEGRRRAEVLATEPASYRRYRESWAVIRDEFMSLIPTAGQEAGDVRFEMRHRTDESTEPLLSNEIALEVIEQSAKLTMRQAIEIAKRYALKEGQVLSDYQDPTGHFDKSDHAWNISFVMHEPTPPGGHFNIIVDDRTGEVRDYFPGL